MRRSSRVLWLVVCCACAGCGGSSTGHPSVEAYCSYGAVSEAQLESCIEHVTPETVEGYGTNAARYARGEIDQCRSDAGPFCEER